MVNGDELNDEPLWWLVSMETGWKQRQRTHVTDEDKLNVHKNEIKSTPNWI